MAERTVEIASNIENELTAIDIGAGEGRGAVFFAEHGWKVYVVDISRNGLEKAEQLAEHRAIELKTIQADANELTFPIYSAGTVQYIRPENQNRQFSHCKS